MEEQRAFGSYLRAERELRQIPLYEVAAATKIPQQSLVLLEQGAWEDLPAPIFVRGFVRSYAKHVGLPVDETCRKFCKILEQRSVQEEVEEGPALDSEAIDVGGRRKFGLALVVIIVLILATITLSLFWRSGAAASAHAAVTDSHEATTTPSRLT